MEVTTILLTYNRPKVLEKCLDTLLNNTLVRPKELYILDDGSEPGLQANLFSAQQQLNQMGLPTRLFLAGTNRGISYQFEFAYQIMMADESDDSVYFFCESDYIWRKGYLEDVLEVFEASPWTVGITGTNHEDFYKPDKTQNIFPQIMTDQFGEDLVGREYLYKPFVLETKTRKGVEVAGSSNSCGCMFIHWGRLKRIFNEVEGAKEKYLKDLERAFHKNGTGNRKLASDGHMSSLVSMMGEKWIIQNNQDLSKNFGMLSITKSISSHRAVGGVNGMVYGMQEMDTFVMSPGFEDKYLEIDPIIER